MLRQVALSLCDFPKDEFEDPRHAEDAIHRRDGYNFDGNRLRVELTHGGRGHSSTVSNSYGGGGRCGGVSKHSEYRVLITGLPSSASWQDLKDHMRKAGDVCYSEVYREGSGTIGIADYTNYSMLKRRLPISLRLMIGNCCFILRRYVDGLDCSADLCVE